MQIQKQTRAHTHTQKVEVATHLNMLWPIEENMNRSLCLLFTFCNHFPDTDLSTQRENQSEVSRNKVRPGQR